MVSEVIHKRNPPPAIPKFFIYRKDVLSFEIMKTYSKLQYQPITKKCEILNVINVMKNKSEHRLLSSQDENHLKRSLVSLGYR